MTVPQARTSAYVRVALDPRLHVAAALLRGAVELLGDVADRPAMSVRVTL